MITAFIFISVLLAGPIAILFGDDSRRFDTRDRRTWWPGSPRSR
jgi:hypothetical protein